MSVTSRPRYLFVVASSCQMYSGTGTAIFDFVDHCSENFEFAFLIDVLYERSFTVTAKFCRQRGIPIFSSEPLLLPGCIDTGIAAASAHLASRSYDFIECVSWANAATNLMVLEASRGRAKLLFTPHSQPLWTLGENYDRYFMVSPTFRRMITDSDAVFVDSRAEFALDEFANCNRNKVHVVSLGVDTTRFRDLQAHRAGHVVCVCDVSESRKRLDLLLAAFEIALKSQPDLHLTLAGNGSDALYISPHLKAKVTGLGYVSAESLVRLYQTSGLFALLSDYEAFGLPIAEALCCGVPVLLNRCTVLEDLFFSMPGVFWTDNSDSQASGLLMAQLALAKPDSGISAEAARRFGWEGTYGRKRNIVLGLIG